MDGCGGGDGRERGEGGGGGGVGGSKVWGGDGGEEGGEGGGMGVVAKEGGGGGGGGEERLERILDTGLVDGGGERGGVGGRGRGKISGGRERIRGVVGTQSGSGNRGGTCRRECIRPTRQVGRGEKLHCEPDERKNAVGGGRGEESEQAHRPQSDKRVSAASFCSNGANATRNYNSCGVRTATGRRLTKLERCYAASLFE